MKKTFIYVLVLTLLIGILPFNNSASASEKKVNEDESQTTLKLETDSDPAIEPYVAPVIIGIAIRSLIQLGKAELARFLKNQGVKAYCKKYGKSGPKAVSKLICN